VLSLASLAGWEEAVLASITAASGTAEERYRQIERSGMFGEYPAILSGYLELFADEESSLEALKRAVFLVWRGAMFSPDVTGIAALPDAISRAVLERLDTAIGSALVDDELAWMLAWYRGIGEFALELLGATPRVLRWEAALGRDAWREAGVAPATMRRRGQLGLYWAELAQRTS
jgi:hypothetical protein